MRCRWIGVTIALAVVACAGDAQARLDVYVDKATQRMAVVQDGYMRYMWPVSAGRDGYATPNGVYAPERLERSWFSREYYDAPMPYAIFFHNGYAIHGSDDINRLGGPASRGCIRLHPQDAALLFAMVEQEGPENTTIVVGDGNQPIPRPPRARGPDELTRPVAPPDAAIAKAAPAPRPRPAPLSPAPLSPAPLSPAPMSDPPRAVEPPTGVGPAVTRGAKELPAPQRRRIGDGGQPAAQAASRIAEPRTMPPADRGANATAAAPARRSDPQPAATASASPPLPTPRRDPDNANDAAKGLRQSGDESAPSRPTATPAPEPVQAGFGYKVLPKSYWSGASWRWRANGEPDAR